MATIKKYTFEIYKSKDGYRWRLKSRNGKIVADCAESYKRKTTIVRFIEDVQWDQIHFECIDKTMKGKLAFNKSFAMREHYKEVVRSK